VESTLRGEELLPDQGSLTLSHVETDNLNWIINAASGQKAANCPDCGALSTARHSSYVRRLKDLPVQGRAVRLTVRVGRWHCRNRGCVRRIFCQRLPEIAHKHARETKRLDEVSQAIAYALGGRPGERLSRRLGILVSRDTLLRRLNRVQSHPLAEPVPAVGVDEWAWRKGQSYGTILVDLERGVVADLLPDRSAASFEKWLQEHPEVRIVSRDRDGVYAEGGYSGAPRAQQVADRFHLVQSLIRAVQDELAHQSPRLLMPSAQEFVGDDTPQKAVVAAPEDVALRQRRPRWSLRLQEIHQQRWQQKQELFGMVKGLRIQGMRAFEIVKVTSLCRGTVDKWLRLSECPPLRSKKAPRPGMAEYLREELRLLWDQGYQNGTKLLDEIRKRGYIGSYSSLLRFLQPWREEKRAAKRKEVAAQQPTQGVYSSVSAMRHVSPQEAAIVLSKPKPMLNKRQCEIVEFLKRTPDFATMRHLVLSFRSILRNGTVSSLKRWIKKAEAAGIAAISKFIRQLKRDREAVENAVAHRWSNGPVEGHINRLKTVKRQMYGRAGFELLRSRILPLAA
jgi:transposase